MAWRIGLLILSGLPAIAPLQAAANVVIWDSGSRLAATSEIATRTGWSPVPSELFALEADPPKAASDPGYYGREYSFKGDAIVENAVLAAHFRSADGRVAIYSQDRAAGDARDVRPGRKLLEFTPFQARTPGARLSRVEIVRNAGDEATLQVTFSAQGAADASACFSFGRTDIVEIRPGAGTKTMDKISLFSPVEYGVVPGFVGDDLIFDPAAYPSADTLHLPSENLFLGLLKGEDRMLVMTWPKGRQQLALRLTQEPSGNRQVESIEFGPDGQGVYLAVLAAPGIWHREQLKPTHLEKDVASQWRRPFPAKWKTQLTEAGARTTFAFREAKGHVWRGVPGSYEYPVWFDGDTAWYHLSKKVPPKGDSLIYFLEGQNTPPSISTPVEILQATLGRQASEPILDTAGRKLRTHHRRGGEGVHRACTCGCTEAIQAIFEAGQEVTGKAQVKEALGDMTYFVERHVERIEEYRRFADDLSQFLRAKASASPELKPYLEGLDQLVQQIPQEYTVQKENMKSPAHVGELTRQTMALTGSKDPGNLKAYMELLKAWRAMGGAQDYVVAQCHVVTRKVFQEAGYGCVGSPQAAAVASEVRERCRRALRNPDGYEIWAEY